MSQNLFLICAFVECAKFLENTVQSRQQFVAVHNSLRLKYPSLDDPRAWIIHTKQITFDEKAFCPLSLEIMQWCIVWWPRK